MFDNFVMALAGAGGNGGVIEGGSVSDSGFSFFLSFDDVIETVDMLVSSFSGLIELLSKSLVPGYEVTVLEILLGGSLGIFLGITLLKFFNPLISS